jgi:hypothetical protein
MGSFPQGPARTGGALARSRRLNAEQLRQMQAENRQARLAQAPQTHARRMDSVPVGREPAHRGFDNVFAPVGSATSPSRTPSDYGPSGGVRPSGYLPGRPGPAPPMGYPSGGMPVQLPPEFYDLSNLRTGGVAPGAAPFAPPTSPSGPTLLDILRLLLTGQAAPAVAPATRRIRRVEEM